LGALTFPARRPVQAQQPGGNYMTGSGETPSLRIIRKFKVAPEVAFDTFTKPESMRVWWTDQTTFDIDLRIGGHWTIIRKEADETYTMTGEYLEVQRPNRLRFTIAMPQFSPNSDTITIAIEERSDGGCIVTFEQVGPDIAQELREVQPGQISASEEGWQQAFDLMEAHWANHA
jgi:uncharacterized protein YndB with AHSA1/START domain